ncbi:39S ribosomal protein L34, mitochondrial [Melanotaenia boesemani]|uniref:39S ribosomal protein L34, mitochondrial n=1 Tax=Melanotaenia boesemani TaxID=1250792 RepID=UPI001C04B430|nr:39S ribosomal protein L34, mitochondrial [Melanotaenia boesemani]
MNVVLWTFSRLRGITHVSRFPTGDLTGTGTSHLRLFSHWIVSSTAAKPQISRLPTPLSSQAEGSETFQQLPWQYQQVRTRKRGTEYQPSNIKRKRTHGWIKRVSSQGGIEVILRRMLKGRKSLTH